jgi:hypothetical protein
MKPGQVIVFCKNCFAQAGWKVTVLLLLLLPLFVFYLGGGRQAPRVLNSPPTDSLLCDDRAGCVEDTLATSCQAGAGVGATTTDSSSSCSSSSSSSFRLSERKRLATPGPSSSKAKKLKEKKLRVPYSIHSMPSSDSASAYSCRLPAQSVQRSGTRGRVRRVANDFTLCVTTEDCTMEVRQ